MDEPLDVGAGPEVEQPQPQVIPRQVFAVARAAVDSGEVRQQGVGGAHQAVPREKFSLLHGGQKKSAGFGFYSGSYIVGTYIAAGWRH